MSDEDDKKTELPLGKETEANLFKSRSIFIYGPINQELAQKVCSQLVALAAASDELVSQISAWLGVQPLVAAQ